ncbi:MAG: ATP-binding protein [Tessaracoccus sp.]|uniref:AlbA family DNA-binding domain-containing protein n=1 Tax=Tessaracoccus sp. TaxID=1971211 RepID=UPI001EB5D955|nr:ATP-binding protein [Tessaracoccus sp.]MBK7823501.1 ATP-binding protein [Tessaracoccus sp.]
MAVKAITTQPELEALVVRGRPETATVEFKKTIDGWNAKGAPDEVRQKAQRELCLDLSQMANSSGGHVVYGVEEILAPDGVKVAGDWAPLADPEPMKAWIDDVLPNYCVPSTFTKESHLVDIPGGRALVVTVQPSRSAVYLWDRNRHFIQCVVRTSTGKKYMNPNELERHLMDGTRAAKLAFDDVWANPNRRDDVVVADGIWSHGKASETRLLAAEPVRIGHRDDATFQLNIPIDRAIVLLALPYSLLEHVWLDGQLRMTLMLGVRLVYRGDGFTLRPFR